MKIHLETEVERTPRVMQLEGIFDLKSSNKSVTDIELNIPDLSTKKWNIGLIVGPSGAGKSTVAKAMFGDVLQKTENLQWDSKKSVVDNFPNSYSIKEITELLSSVGFSSPPAWLRPFHTLSNGEQFRVTMARVLAENKELAVVDEFTSVVDRTVAQIGSAAIAKTVRRKDQKFIAVSCHYDIEEWLQPDWIYQPATSEFIWGSVQPRPQITLKVFHAKYDAWKSFARHHYLSHDLNPAAQIYIATVNDQPAALIAILTLVGRVPNAKRVSRIVVLPDYQGIGLGNKFLAAIGSAFKAKGFVMYITTSHPAFMRSLNANNQWKMGRQPSRSGRQNNDMQKTSSMGRITASFLYQGEANAELADVLNIPTAKRIVNSK